MGECLRMAEEKIYTVPLRREFLKVAKYNRSKKAMKALKEFLLKHLKEEVKIGKYLNEEVSKRRKNPPGKIKIRIDGEKGKYKAELINAPKEEVKKEEKGKIEKLKEKVVGKKEEKVEEKKETKEDKPKIVEEKKLDKEIVIKKEETKKAIEKIPEKEKTEEVSKISEKKHAHRKQEKIIPNEKVKF